MYSFETLKETQLRAEIRDLRRQLREAELGSLYPFLAGGRGLSPSKPLDVNMTPSLDLKLAAVAGVRPYQDFDLEVFAWVEHKPTRRFEMRCYLPDLRQMTAPAAINLLANTNTAMLERMAAHCEKEAANEAENL